MARKAGMFKTGTAFEETTSFASRFNVGGAVLVVRDLMKRQTTLVVGRVVAIRVCASGRNGAFAGRVD